MRIEATILYNKGVLLLEAKKYEKAEALFRKSIKLFPSKEAYLNIATCYKSLGMDRKCFESLVLSNSEKTPFINGSFSSEEYTLALNNLGLYYYAVGNDDKAIACYRRVLELDPEYYTCAWNLGCALLRKACSGHTELFDEGWALYQERFRKTNPVVIRYPNPNVKLWDGSFVESILVYAEQGHGDNLMFARYIPLLKKFCKRVIVQCPLAMQSLFSDYECVEDGASCDATHAIFMPSLAHIFPMMPGDWLRGRFSVEKSADINIGIVFAGNPDHANDMNRSVPVHRFHAFAKYGKLWCLTPGFRGSKYVNALNIETWDDTCREIMRMDLVICVDTSVAHLCGCLGAECWMLQPLKDTDFRWGNHNSSSNMWYSSVKVYRNPGSWDAVFAQVERDLKDRYYVK